MGRRPINEKAMTDAERQRRRRARQGKAPILTMLVDAEEVVECAKRAGPEALEQLWERERDRAIEAIGILDLLVKIGHVTKYAKGKIDLQAEIDTAWEALFENLEGRVVFRDDE
jgi:hypothetical protein